MVKIITINFFILSYHLFFTKGMVYMKTNQIMQTTDRELSGVIVRQRTCDSFFALSDIARVIAKNTPDNVAIKRVDSYFILNSSKNFIQELDSNCGKSYIKGRGKNTSWVHPYIAIDILLWANPKFKIEVYQWLWDYLIENRIKSGDSYSKMCGVLYSVSRDKTNFHKNIQNLAKIIKDTIGVDDWNQATSEQLELREYAHNMIADLAKTLHDSTKGASLGIQALKEHIKSKSAIISI